VGEKSSLIDKTWHQSKAGEDAGASLIKLLRDDKATWKPMKTTIRAGDVLLMHGHVDKLLAMQEKYGLEIRSKETVKDQKLTSDEIKLIETLVPPPSRLVGRTLGTADFFRRFGCTVLALQRRGRIQRERIADIRLESGDTLLLQGDREDLSRLMHSSDLIVTSELTDLYFRKDRAMIALAMLSAVVLLAAFNIVPILVAALIGGAGMLLGRCLSMEEAYRAIDWKVIFLLGGILPLGLALEQTGAALWLTDVLLKPFAGSGPLVVLAVLYLTTAILTETMSNNAAAVILAPIALSFASSMGADPRPFLVAITFAASTSFATPIGYQTNTMIFAPGGYRFMDYTRLGGPLNLIFWILAVIFIPLLWPF